MNRRRRLFTLGLLGAWAAAYGKPVSPPWRFGLIPYLSARRLISTYAPLARHLDRQGLPVLLTTAPDNHRFLLRALGGEFDVLLGAPHFCRYLQVEMGYRPLFQIDRDLSASLVVRPQTLKRFEDLRGHAVATPEATSMTSLLGMEALRQAGMEPYQDVAVIETASQLSALLTLRSGRVAGAFISTSALAGLPAEAKQGLEVVTRTPGVPHLAMMAHHRLSEESVQRFIRSVQDFLGSSGEGQRFLLDTGYGGMSVPREAALKQLDRYLPQLRLELEGLRVPQ